MGTVYLAEQKTPNRLCALKFVHHESQDAYRRFAREADVAARLEDPSIATVYAFGEHNGRAYLATECADGAGEPVTKEEAAASLRRNMEAAPRINGNSDPALWERRGAPGAPVYLPGGSSPRFWPPKPYSARRR